MLVRLITSPSDKMHHKVKLCFVIINACTKPPHNIRWSALNQTAVKVTWEPPGEGDTVDGFIACTNGSDVKRCKTKEDNGCVIEGLLPSSPYEVCVRACRANAVTRRTKSSAFSGAQFVSIGNVPKYEANFDSNSYTCSDPSSEVVTIPIKAFMCVDLNTSAVEDCANGERFSVLCDSDIGHDRFIRNAE
ncbi:hypothetical protein TSMEX_007649 [Taenia solium]|eukprot:TsM_000142500 transcript=TsM_000142500 gene=TsM_000142500